VSVTTDLQGSEVMVEATKRGRPRGVVIVATLMVIFGMAEVITAFTGRFLGGISVTTSSEYTIAAAATGSCYSLAGIFVLTMKRWGAGLGIVFLCAELIGRLYLVSTGLYPLSGPDEGAFVAGSIIAALFALYIGLRWHRFG
jgi:hypothetical protein